MIPPWSLVEKLAGAIATCPPDAAVRALLVVGRPKSGLAHALAYADRTLYYLVQDGEDPPVALVLREGKSIHLDDLPADQRDLLSIALQTYVLLCTWRASNSPFPFDLGEAK